MIWSTALWLISLCTFTQKKFLPAMPLCLSIVGGTAAVLAGKYSHMHFQDWLALKYQACFTLVCFLLLAMVATSRSLSKGFLTFFVLGSLVTSLYIIFNRFAGASSYNSAGVLGNASMVACMLSSLFPLVVSNLNRLMFKGVWYYGFIGIYVSAIFLTGSSLGIGLLSVGCSGVIIIAARTKVLAITGVYLGAGSLGYLLLGGNFFNTSARTGIWKISMSWWWENDSVWLGVGPGATTIFLPHIQVLNKWTNNFYVYLHNDWLQILFELGIVGLVASLVFYLFLLYKSLYDKYLTISLVCYGLFMLGNWPLHMPLTALLGATLVGLAWRSNEYNNNKT